MNSPQIVGLGGYPDDAMLDHILGLARGRRLLYVPTAGAEDPSTTLSWYSRLHGRADLAHLHLFPWPPDGLGFLSGSACPHYDGEERRRPVYQQLVRDGFPPGLALDDAAGAHYVGTGLHEIVASSPEARGYLVGPDGEHELDARLL